MRTIKQRIASIPVDEERLAFELSSKALPSQRYLIYTNARTGSSWLREILQAAKLLGRPDEWFDVALVEDFAKAKNCNSVDSYARLSQLQEQSSNGVYGATIAWESLVSLWPDILSEGKSDFFNHFPVGQTQSFMLARRDIIAQAISLYRLRRLNILNAGGPTSDERAEAQENLPYDELAINACLDELVYREERLLSFFENHKIRPHTLVYEDMTLAAPFDVAQYFIERVLPGVTLNSSSDLNGLHWKVSDEEDEAFNQRFRLDHSSKVGEIESQRQRFLAEADFLVEANDPSCIEKKKLQTNISGAQTRSRGVTVIVPVYSGLQATKRCLESVLRSFSMFPFRLVVIYDAGPDRRVKEYVEGLAEKKLIELFKNNENKGFVKTVNYGFDLAATDDVIVLNSDTEVAPGWVDRMVALADTDDKIATITPLTNNGEIASFPNLCEVNDLPTGLTTTDVDRIASTNLPQAIDIPTGVGFCLFISREALNEVGLFDADTFGRGYGEETDFCRRAAAAGWRNVLQFNVYVFHEGSISFGDQKKQLLQRSSLLIEQRHPGYHRSIELYCRADECRLQRFHFVLQCIAEKGVPTILVVGHGEGGGTRRYIQELRRYFRFQLNILWLEPEKENKIRLIFPTWATGHHLTLDQRKDRDILIDILCAVRIDSVYINHTRGIEIFTKELLDQLNIKHLIMLHDYYFIADSPSLTDQYGSYSIDTFIDSENSSVSSCTPYKMALLESATKIIAPSVETADIYKQFIPDLEIDVHEHIGSELITTLLPVQTAEKRSDGVKRVVVVGALGLEKGADLLEQVAEIVRAQQTNIEFHLVGYAYRKLSDAIITHGRYEENNLTRCIEELAPDIVWYPCQWPETYSYTLSAVLERGFPLLIPNFGAFVSRTEGRPFTWKVPFDLSPEQYADNLIDCLAKLQALVGVEESWSPQPLRSKYYTNNDNGFLSDCCGDAPKPDQLPAIEHFAPLFATRTTMPQINPDLPRSQTRFQRVVEEIFWKLRSSDAFVLFWNIVFPRKIRTRLRIYLLGR